MRPQEPEQRTASAERHEISRPEPADLSTESESSSDRIRFLRLAGIALDSPNGTPCAELGAVGERFIWHIEQWDGQPENRRRARELLHYVQD